MLDKETLVEASYKIGMALFKKIPKSEKSTGYVRGYQKAGDVIQNVLKRMIDEAKDEANISARIPPGAKAGGLDI